MPDYVLLKKEEVRSNMIEWMQALAIVATIISGVLYIHSEIKDLRVVVQQQNERLDELYQKFSQLIKEKRGR